MCFFIRHGRKWKQCVAKYKVKLNTHPPCVLFFFSFPFSVAKQSRNPFPWISLPLACLPFQNHAITFYNVSDTLIEWHQIGRDSTSWSRWGNDVSISYLFICVNAITTWAPFNTGRCRGECSVFITERRLLPLWSFHPCTLSPCRFYFVASILDPSVLKQGLPLPSHQLSC